MPGLVQVEVHAVEVIWVPLSVKTVAWGVRLKRQIFCFWFFSWISFPPAPEYPIRTVSNIFENSQRYSQVKVHHWYQWHRQQIWHWYQWHRRQILPLVSLGLLIPVANKICHQCQRYRDKFAANVNDTGGKLLPVSTSPGLNLPPVSMTLVANNGNNMRLQIPYIYLLTFTIQKDVPTKLLKFPIKDFFPLPPVSTTTVVNLELWISPWIVEKIWNCPVGILRGLGETDSWKKPEV